MGLLSRAMRDRAQGSGRGLLRKAMTLGSLRGEDEKKKPVGHRRLRT